MEGFDNVDDDDDFDVDFQSADQFQAGSNTTPSSSGGEGGGGGGGGGVAAAATPLTDDTTSVNTATTRTNSTAAAPHTKMTAATSADGLLAESSAHAAAAPALQSRDSPWRIGQAVVHAKFGAGVIVGSEGGGADARVQVNFRNSGPKWLMLEYAKLTAA